MEIADDALTAVGADAARGGSTKIEGCYSRHGMLIWSVGGVGGCRGGERELVRGGRRLHVQSIDGSITFTFADP